jgi:DNA invertase Pin-like site-specific DNA recombinase
MSKKVAIYARVSTDKQTTENQLNELIAVANRMGYVIVQEYVENGISGAKSRSERPSLDVMLKDAVEEDLTW